VGVGLCRALDAYLPTPCRLKWPNDLLVAGKKIGGILIESLVRPGDCALVVVGFGVNLAQTAADLPHDRATSICLEGGASVPLAQLTWDLVLGVEQELLHLGDAAYAVAQYRERTVHQPGDLLTCQVGEERVSGRFVGFDPEGRLLLDADGRELRLAAGEVIEG
jgi:BirA family transcriptional regulator, biotin operon repressor / biotin---[acetyl-CoA-carboxylase] ligase